MEQGKDNKMILQSYKLTTIRNDFGIYAQRLIVRIAEAMQYRLQGADLQTGNIKPCDPRLKWKFNLSDLQQAGEKHHSQIKSELRKVIKASVYEEYENGWRDSIIFTDIDFNNSGTIQVKINDSVWDLFVELSKGFKKYQLDTAMKLQSTYALRLYQLLNGNTTPITYEIDWLKELFQVKNKYTLNKDFIKWVIVPAKKELDEKAETSFTFIVNQTSDGRGRPRISSLTFFPINGKSVNSDILTKEMARKYGYNMIATPYKVKLMQGYNFTEQGIRANAELIYTASVKIENFHLWLDSKRAKAMTADNPQGWILRAMSGEIKKLSGDKKTP